MAKKKSCQNVRNPRVLSPVERELHGWVNAEVFTQSSVLTSEHFPELLREMRLAQDPASERDFVLEAARPSDQLPFQALEDRTHFLWVYTELFMRLGIQLPFSDFQREVLTWCRVAASKLHLNGCGFLRTFERGNRRDKPTIEKTLKKNRNRVKAQRALQFEQQEANSDEGASEKFSEEETVEENSEEEIQDNMADNANN
ncbi:hypothetical protein PIB30_091510 [Stylosanthes scabra]|uniref:Uncharacterized protein n=1 Tax=Stylosanthes scabra TaxID=79078 RepID=A0ABU6SVB5_9FABA|nr:hypothetical protein [Stylosanthes scabra]